MDAVLGRAVIDALAAIRFLHPVAHRKFFDMRGRVVPQNNALTQPKLWCVEQTVAAPDCYAAGGICPTITVLMPLVYLPENWNARAAGGSIEASNGLTLDFGSAATSDSILNIGSTASGDTLKSNTGTLTNEANQVDAGQIWNSVKGGFMSAADIQLKVAALNQIGGAFQELNADGSVDQAGTQQLLAQLQQQLGADFKQQTLGDKLNKDFV